VTHRYLVVAFVLAAPLFGGSFSYVAVTTGQPTFHRPEANGNLAPTALSGYNNSVTYSAQSFNVDQAGIYTINSVGTSPSAWDNYTILYNSTFNPLNPLANAIIANDDNPFVGTSGFSVNLAIGNYVLVTTGWLSFNAGTASNTISGPGNVTAPETGTMAMLGLGLVILGAAKSKSATAI
jgi:hypothetical protein